MKISPFLAVPLPCVVALAVPAETDWHLLPAFTADPALLLKDAAARKPKEGQGILELLEETNVTFDTQGRRETRYRYVFRVDHESAIKSWRSIVAVWVPWHQEKPSIRARVITPDGKAHTLDGATVGEFPMNEEGTTLYDDRKQLAAPLPQLSLGSVAEVEIITRETAPVHASGTLVTIPLHQPVPVMRTRVLVDVPESMPFRWKLTGLGPVLPQRRQEGGRVRLAVELGSMEPPEEREPDMDPDVQPLPILTFSTSPSWASAASGYAEIAERQMAGADLSAWAREAIGDAGEPVEKINRLLNRLGRTVRYTGVEFGQASVVPRTPAETLRRGFGDCKDKAALLVALLREAGIKARMALLETGPGKDVDPELPGLNHFDHAIVFVPGPEPLWIDPTAEYARAGDLPHSDQGRNALVVDRDTTDLVRTPVVPSTGNLTLETREVFLAESGKARIVETSHPDGLAEMKLRGDFQPTDPKKLRENLKRYVQGSYSATDLGEYSVGDPSDLGRPFTVRLEALGCGTAATSDIDAAVTLNAWEMLAGLRKRIPTSFDRKEKEPAQRRKQDLIFPEPYAMEWRHRITVPIGFAARPLPEADRVDFGPASLTRTFSRNPEGPILATFRFDSGKARWTPAEVEAARSALEAFGNAPPMRLLFDQVGEAHLAAGRINDAIRTFRAQAQAQPSKGVPLSRLAIALIRGGLGEAARDAARKACRLEPSNMFVHRALGWVLLHDLVNRIYHKGWDYSGALASYRKAKDLDPQDVLTRKNLAILLEYNKDGMRYGPGADLTAAIKEYEDLRKDLHVEDLNVNLLTVLWRAGRYKDAEACARTLPTPREGYPWMLAGAAVTKGPEAALKEAGSSITDQEKRRAALLDAGNLLANARKYGEAATLLAAGAEGSADAPAIRGRVAVLARTRRYEDIPHDTGGPASVVWSLLKTIVDPSATDEDLFSLFTPALIANGAKKGDLKSLRGGLGFNTMKQDGTGVSPALTLDVLYAMSQVVVTGDPVSGFKVNLQVPGAGESSGFTWYVVQKKGRFLLAATDGATATLGIEALSRLEGGDLAGAKSMLDQARDVVWAGKKDDPLSGNPFCRFWEKGQNATPDEVRAAAASLQATDKDCVRAVPLLEAARTPEGAERIDVALLVAHQTRSEWNALLPIGERLMKAHPKSKVAAEGWSAALNGAGKWPELLRAADQLLAQAPDDADYVGWKAKALGMLGRFQEREDLLKACINSGKATSAEFNNLAWSTLAHGRVTDQSIEWARRSVLLKSEKNGAAQHTLASLLAERGEASEALDIFLKEISTLDEDDPRSQDWYLIGRIAEQFGEDEAAIGCFRRVTPPREQVEPEADTCFALAARRLKILTKSL